MFGKYNHDLSKYTMDHPDFIVCSFIENSIGLNRVNLNTKKIFHNVKKQFYHDWYQLRSIFTDLRPTVSHNLPNERILNVKIFHRNSRRQISHVKLTNQHQKRPTKQIKLRIICQTTNCL